jgi:hypothetical protein
MAVPFSVPARAAGNFVPFDEIHRSSGTLFPLSGKFVPRDGQGAPSATAFSPTGLQLGGIGTGHGVGSARRGAPRDQEAQMAKEFKGKIELDIRDSTLDWSPCLAAARARD